MGRDAAVLFHEEQGFRKWPAMLLLALPPGALVAITLRQMVWHHPWGNPPASNGGLLFLTVLLLLVYIRLNTVRLVTDLYAAEVAVRLRGLWIKRKVSLDTVRLAKTVDYDPAGGFGGHGIRSDRRGQVYIAHGSHLLEFEMNDGRRVLIGSQEPERLAKRITDCRLGAS